MSLDRHKAVQKHFQIVHVHIGAFHVPFSNPPNSVICLGFCLSIFLDLFQLMRHALNFHLQVGAAHPLTINLLREEVELELEPVGADLGVDNR